MIRENVKHCNSISKATVNVTPLTFGTYWFKSSWTCYDRFKMPHAQEINYFGEGSQSSYISD